MALAKSVAVEIWIGVLVVRLGKVVLVAELGVICAEVLVGIAWVWIFAASRVEALVVVEVWIGVWFLMVVVGGAWVWVFAAGLWVGALVGVLVL